MSKKLIKSGMIVSGMTLASRVMGLVRDVVIANLLGAGVAADVFFFANRIPNFLRRLFAEGAFNQAFVPVMTEYKKNGDEQAVRELLAAVAGTLGGIVTVVTLLNQKVLSGMFGLSALLLVSFYIIFFDGPKALAVQSCWAVSSIAAMSVEIAMPGTSRRTPSMRRANSAVS